MTCTGCGSNNAYTGNCGCSEPIELICTGDTGATGPPGNAGADGIALFDNIIVPGEAVAGVSIDNVYTKVIHNTALVQEIDIGSYFVIEGFCRYNNSTATNNKYTATITITGGATMDFSMYLNPNTSGNLYFRIELHRRTATGFVSREFAMWTDSLNGYGEQIPSVYRYAPAESAIFNFLADITIDIVLSKELNPGGAANFIVSTPCEASLVSFAIIKYVK